MAQNNCETCANYIYDETEDCYFCSVNLDEDEIQRFLTQSSFSCGYWRNGDDYAVVRKQN